MALEAALTRPCPDRDPPPLAQDVHPTNALNGRPEGVPRGTQP